MEIQQIVQMLAKLQASQNAYYEKIMAMSDALHERTIACFGQMETRLEYEEPTSGNIKDDRNEMTAYNEATEEIEKINPGMMQSVEEHQDVLNEDVAVMPVGEPKKRRRGRKLTSVRCGGPKKLNRGNCGSWKKLAAACRKVSCHATVAWRKRKVFRKSETRGYCGSRKGMTVADRRTSRHATVAWRKTKFIRNIRIQESRESSKDFAVKGMREGPGCKNGVRRRNIKEPPHLRIERKTASSSGGRHKREQRRLKRISKYNDIYWRTIGLDFVKQVVRMSSGFLQIRVWRLWRGRPPPKRKKKL
jgi:hypothetical protein